MIFSTFGAHMQLDLQDEELRVIMLMDSESGIWAENSKMACLCSTACATSAGEMQMAGSDSRGWVLESPGNFFIACLGPELSGRGWVSQRLRLMSRAPPRGPSIGLAFSPHGNWVLTRSASRDCVWWVSAEQVLQETQGEDARLLLSLSPEVS